MSVIQNGRRALKKMVFGESLLPQEFTIGLKSPQTEIILWLYGIEEPRDVTHHHSTACSEPFVFCISFEEWQIPSEEEMQRLSLRFCERGGQKRVLGEIQLCRAAWKAGIDSRLLFFEARGSKNYCLPKLRLWAHSILDAYRGQVGSSDVKMSLLERRAAVVSFIRPHPVAIGSAADDAGGNIFIMNLMGELGGGRFAFGLKDSRKPAHLVGRTGRLALSSVPFDHGQLAFRLAANHFKESIDWKEVPFAMKLSAMFKIPVPVFALRVREMEVEAMHRIGSHTLFVAKIVHEEIFAEDEEELHAVHGFYQAWRLRGCSSELKASLVKDSFNKQGLASQSHT